MKCYEGRMVLSVSAKVADIRLEEHDHVLGRHIDDFDASLGETAPAESEILAAAEHFRSVIAGAHQCDSPRERLEGVARKRVPMSLRDPMEAQCRRKRPPHRLIDIHARGKHGVLHEFGPEVFALLRNLLAEITHPAIANVAPEFGQLYARAKMPVTAGNPHVEHDDHGWIHALLVELPRHLV